MMPLPATYDIDVYQGDDYDLPIRVLDTLSAPIDLTGTTIEAQVRATAASTSVLASFGVVITTPQTGGNIGKATLSLTNVQTTGLAANSYVWDMQITWTDGKRRTYLAGKFTVTAEVTRA